MHTDPATYQGTLVPDWASRLTVRLVRTDERERWRTIMAQYHYLGFRGLVGESLYYVAELNHDWVALLGWAAAAWMCRGPGPMDWLARPQQWERLHFVMNNARFLILPDVHIPNLASKVLALAAVLAGQRTFVAIGDWIQDLRPEQRAAFGCPRWGDTYKVPSEPTVRRVLQQLDVDALDAVLTQWLTVESLQPGDAIALNGKSVRGSGHGTRKRPVHLLSALVHRTGQVPSRRRYQNQ